ncbi:MAG: hypothetical protein ACRENE_27735, partial [Polyangiaceae bacterium]
QVFVCVYGGASVVQKTRDNYARRQGDANWRRDLDKRCIHCGLLVWTPGPAASGGEPAGPGG